MGAAHPVLAAVPVLATTLGAEARRGGVLRTGRGAAGRSAEQLTRNKDIRAQFVAASAFLPERTRTAHRKAMPATKHRRDSMPPRRYDHKGRVTVVYSRDEHEAEMEERLQPPYADVEVVFHIGIKAPGGARNFIGNAEDAVAAEADSLAFAAQVFGLSKREYLEWLRYDGAALCGARLADGDFCSNRVLPLQSDAGDWKAAHRQRLCKRHDRSG